MPARPPSKPPGRAPLYFGSLENKAGSDSPKKSATDKGRVASVTTNPIFEAYRDAYFPPKFIIQLKALVNKRSNRFTSLELENGVAKVGLNLQLSNHASDAKPVWLCLLDEKDRLLLPVSLGERGEAVSKEKALKLIKDFLDNNVSFAENGTKVRFIENPIRFDLQYESDINKPASLSRSVYIVGLGKGATVSAPTNGGRVKGGDLGTLYTQIASDTTIDHHKKYQLGVLLSFLADRFSGKKDQAQPQHNWTELAVIQAEARLRGAGVKPEWTVKKTPALRSELLEKMTGAKEVWLKLDSHQNGGSFKVYGATNKAMAYLQDLQNIHQVDPKEALDQTALVAATHGNHGQGVMLAKNNLGFREAIIVMPLHEQTAKVKIRSCLKMGATVILHGKNLEEAMQLAEKIAANEKLSNKYNYVTGRVTDEELSTLIKKGKTVVIYGKPSNFDISEEQVRMRMANLPPRKLFIPTYDDVDVSLGQSVSASHLVGDVPQLAIGALTYVVPSGGLGLMAGIATALHYINPEAKIIGFNTEDCPVFARSLELGRLDIRTEEVFAVEQDTASDGIDVKKIGAKTFGRLLELRKLKENIYGPQGRELVAAGLVTEREVQEALVFANGMPWVGSGANTKSERIEGASATTIAALLNGSLGDVKGQRLVLHISGKNIDEHKLQAYTAKNVWVHDPDFFSCISSTRAFLRNPLLTAEESREKIAILNSMLDDSHELGIISDTIKKHDPATASTHIRRKVEEHFISRTRGRGPGGGSTAGGNFGSRVKGLFSGSTSTTQAKGQKAKSFLSGLIRKNPIR